MSVKKVYTYLSAGDSGYPGTTYLLTPIANPQTPAEVEYNRCHTGTRVIVERAFGLLKSRFRCLHKSAGALQYEPRKCSKIAMACMWLHNICLDMGAHDPELVDSDESASYPGAAGGVHQTHPNITSLRQDIGERLLSRQ